MKKTVLKKYEITFRILGAEGGVGKLVVWADNTVGAKRKYEELAKQSKQGNKRRYLGCEELEETE